MYLVRFFPINFYLFKLPIISRKMPHLNTLSFVLMGKKLMHFLYLPSTRDSAVRLNTVMHHLTMGVRLEKCIIPFHRCVNA